MQVLRCGAPCDLAGCVSVRPAQASRTHFPHLLLFIHPHLLGALIPSHGFKFHLPFSMFTLVLDCSPSPLGSLGLRSRASLSQYVQHRLQNSLSSHSSPPCLPGLNKRPHFSPGCSSFHLQSSSTHLFLSHPASNPSEKIFLIHYWFGFPIWFFKNYFWYCKHHHFWPSLLHFFANFLSPILSCTIYTLHCGQSQ